MRTSDSSRSFRLWTGFSTTYRSLSCWPGPPRWTHAFSSVQAGDVPACLTDVPTNGCVWIGITGFCLPATSVLHSWRWSAPFDNGTKASARQSEQAFRKQSLREYLSGPNARGRIVSPPRARQWWSNDCTKAAAFRKRSLPAVDSEDSGLAPQRLVTWPNCEAAHLRRGPHSGRPGDQPNACASNPEERG